MANNPQKPQDDAPVQWGLPTALSGALPSNLQPPPMPADLQQSLGTSPMGGEPMGAVPATVAQVAQKEGVDPKLLFAMIQQESGGRNGQTSSAGAQGLMQLLPGTFNQVMKGQGDIMNPVDNITAGARYLKQQLTNFGGSIPLALAAYNAGPGAVQKAGNQVPNYAETQNYVKSILAKYTPDQAKSQSDNSQNGAGDNATAGGAQAPQNVPKWSQITGSAKFQKASDSEKEAVRNAYFEQVVAPNLDADQIAPARAQWDDATKPSTWKNIKNAVGNLASDAGNAIKGVASELTSGNLGKDIVQNQADNTATDEQAGNVSLLGGSSQPNPVQNTVTDGMDGQAISSPDLVGMPGRPVGMDAQAWARIVTNVRANPQQAQADAAKIAQMPQEQQSFDQRAFLTAVQNVTGQNQQVVNAAKNGQPDLNLPNQIGQYGMGDDPATVAANRVNQLDPNAVTPDIEQQALSRAQGEYNINQAGLTDPGNLDANGAPMVVHYSNGTDATISDLGKIEAAKKASLLANHPVSGWIADKSPIIGDLIAGGAKMGEGALDAVTLGLNLAAYPINKFAQLVGLPVDGDHAPFQRTGLAQGLDDMSQALSSDYAGKHFDDMKTGSDKAAWVAHQVAQNGVQTLGLLLGGLYPKIGQLFAEGLGAVSAGQQWAQDQATDAPLDRQLTDAVTNGIAEWAGEQLPLHAAHNLAGYIAKLTAEQRASFMGNFLRKTGIALGAMASQAATGGVEEMATQVMQNWSQKYILGDQSVNLTDGVKDAGIVGAALEGGMAGHHALQVATNSPLNSELRRYQAAREALKWKIFQAKAAAIGQQYRASINTNNTSQQQQQQQQPTPPAANAAQASQTGQQSAPPPQGDTTDTEGLNVPAGAVPASQVLDSEQTGEPSAPAQQQQSQSLEPPVTHPAIKVGPVVSQVVTPGGMEATTHFAVVDANHLTTSHNEALQENPNYPQELQPRDRSKMTSELQISRIQRGLDPQQLGDSRLSDSGAPIITQDGTVLSGNGRTIALARAYNAQQGENYRDWLLENAEHFGLDKNTVQGMTAPVLVRVAGSLADPVEFARQSNESAKASMSDHEQAQADANRLTDLSRLNVTDNGDISSNLGDGFNQQFLRQVVPANEHGDMITEDKAAGTRSLSAKGLRRIRNAIMARAYGSHDVVRQMMESLNEGHKNITTALMQMAPRIAKMRDAMQSKPHPALDPSLDLTDKLIGSLAILNHLRTAPNAPSVREWLAQRDIMTEHDPLTDQLVEALDGLKSVKQIRAFLSAYIDTVESLGAPGQGDLIGGDKPDLKAILAEAQRRANPNAEQADIFSQRPGQSAEQPGAAAEQPGSTTEPAGSAAGGGQATEQPGGRSAKRPGSQRTDESQSNGGSATRPQESQAGEVKPAADAGDKFDQDKAKADLEAALGDLGDLLGDIVGKKNLIPSDQQQKLIPILTRVMDAAFRLGYYKFKANVRFTLDTIKSKLGEEHARLLTLDDLQSAYIGMAQHFQDQGADSKKHVINEYETLDDVLKEEPGQQAPEAKPAKQTSKAEPGYPQPFNHLTYDGEPVGQYHEAGETVWDYGKNNADARVSVLQIGKDKWIGGMTVDVLRGKETMWGQRGPLQDRKVFKTKEEAKAYWLEELRKSAEQLANQKVDGKYTTEQGVLRGRMIAEAAAKDLGKQTEQQGEDQYAGKPAHEIPLGEYAKRPEATKGVPAHLSKNLDDADTEEWLKEQTNDHLEQIAFLVGAPISGNKTEKIANIKAYWDMRKQLSQATVEGLQEKSKTELGNMLNVLKIRHSHMNKEGMAKTLIQWRDDKRRQGTQVIAGAKHLRLVKQALTEGKTVPPEVLKDYPKLYLPTLDRKSPEYKQAMEKYARQWAGDLLNYNNAARYLAEQSAEAIDKGDTKWGHIYMDMSDYLENFHKEIFGDKKEKPKLKITRFVSGLSRLKDFFAGRHGGEPIGVDVGELGKEPYKDWYTDAMLDDGGDNPGAHQGWTNTGRASGIVEVGKAVLQGHDVFVDSGAYGIHQANMKRQQNPQQALGAGWSDLALDFNQVMKRYDDIIQAIDTENAVQDPVEWGHLHLVMPDVIGNQAETMALWGKHLSDIRALLPIQGQKWDMNRDTDAIIPLQKGALSLTELYQHAVDLFGTDQFRVGIPANAAAISTKDLAEFIRNVNPAKIHFLGVASPETLNPLIDVIKANAKGDIDITADSTLMRKHLSEITDRVAKGERRHDVIRDIIQREQINKEPTEPAATSQQSDLVDRFYRLISNDQMPKNNRELKQILAQHLGKPADAVSDLDMKGAQEALETAISKRAGEMARRGLKPREIFDHLLNLYKSQPNLNIRTSDSMANQAYSTPAPLAYLAGRLARIEPTSHVYDPTAGNGMLVINADPQHVTANELQEDRAANLNKLGFDVVHGNALDAVKDGIVPAGSQDAVMMNPPFGSLDAPVIVDGYKISKLDHQIVLESLKAMKDDGHAIIIVGANKVAGEITTADRIFLNAVYGNYNVKGHFEVDGKLYSRQGASWPIRVLVIDGRAKTGQFSPATGSIQRFSTWDQVYNEYNRLNQLLDTETAQPAQNGSVSSQNPEGGETGSNGAHDANGGENQQPAGPSNGSDTGTTEQPGQTGGSSTGEPGASTGGNNANGHADQPGGRRDGATEHDNAPAGDRGAENADTGHDTSSSTGHVNINDIGSLDAGALGDIFDSILEEETGHATAAASESQTPRNNDQSTLGDKTGTNNGKNNSDNNNGANWTDSPEMNALDALMHDLPGDHVSFSVAPEMDPNFNKGFYEKFKQLVADLWTKAKAAGSTINDFFRTVIQRYQAKAAQIKPYLVQFSLDMAKAQNDPKAKDKNFDPKSPTGENKTREEAVENEYQVPYQPRSKSPIDAILLPVNQAAPMQQALDEIERTHPAGIDDYVMGELGYKSMGDLFNALNGVQVDSVAMAIHQLKQAKALIIGDQTGIGKGRQAAAIIRWAHKNGHVPVFFTVKDNLFSDMVNDLIAIGSHDLVPFMTNADAKIVSDADDSTRYQMKAAEQNRAIRAMTRTGQLPAGHHMLFATYSQINTSGPKVDAIRALSPNAIFILDESHNAGGASNTGRNMSSFLEDAKGVTYLSATFAKRPDNLPIYFKTDIKKATGDLQGLIDAMVRGGTKLQLVISRMLTQAGQMVRRERSYAGININTIMDEANKARDEHLADETTRVLRAIVDISETLSHYVKTELAAHYAETGESVMNGDKLIHTTVDYNGFNSVVHNYVKQLLLGIKAETTVQHAVNALQNGQKPVIALENTMESFLKDYAEQLGLKAGDPLENFGWNSVLQKALDGTRRFTVKDPHGMKRKETLSYNDMPPHLVAAYKRVEQVIAQYGQKLTNGIPVSPIDYIRQRIEDEGQKLFAAGKIDEPWKMGEITGRTMTVDYSDPNRPTLQVRPTEEKKNKKVTVNKFNRGALHGLVLNVSGSTGLSIHASEHFADQRQRHMIIAQPSADIAIFMQMLGRIHRTGQVNLPEYTILSSALASEKRPTMVLAGKMKSLNANTTTNKDSATSVKTVDFFNKYGDRVTAQWLHENPEEDTFVNAATPLDPEQALEGFARTVTGRLSLLPVADQERFYKEVEAAYQEYYDMRSAMGTNELEQRALDLDAKPRGEPIKLTDATDNSVFGAGSHIQKYDVKRAGKPPKPEEVKAAIKESLGEHPNYATLMDKALLPPVRNAFEHYATDLENKRDAAQRDLNSGKERTEKQQQAARDRVESAQNAINNAERAKNAVVQAVRTLRIGRALKLAFGEDEVTGVITRITPTYQPGDSGNPMTLGKWKVTLMLAAGSRQITMPLTELWNEHENQANPERVLDIDKEPNIDDIFDPDKIGTARMDVHIIQGNLLGAFSQMNGELISFTDHDGQMQQGILLPKKFNPARDLTNHQRMFSAKGILSFLHENRYLTDVQKYGVFNKEENLAVKEDSRGDLIIEAKGGRAGERWHQNDTLKSLSGTQFAGRGSGNVKMVVPPAKAQAVVHYLLEQTPLFARASVSTMAEPHADIPQVQPSIAQGQGRGMVKQDVDQGIQDTLNSWKAKGRPQVEVVQSKADLSPELQDRVTQMEAKGRVRGFLDRATNTAYLIADHLNSVDEALQVLRHEVVAHYGLKAMLGQAYNDVLDRVTLAFPKLVKAKAAAYGFSEDQAGLRKAADEVLAELAEKGKESGFVDRMVARIAKIFRAMGIGHAITMAEVRQLITASNRGLMDNVARLGPDELKGIGKNAFGRDRGLLGKMTSMGVHTVFALNKSVDKLLQVLTDHSVKPAGRLVAQKLSPLGNFIANTQAAQWLASGFISDHGLPEPMKDARTRMQVAQQQAQREIATYIDKLQDLDRLQSRIAYEWMNTHSDSERAQQLINMLPDEHRATLNEIKDLIEQMGRQAVKLGQLSQESFDRNNLAYLHRSYAQYEMDNKGEAGQRRRVVRVLGEQYKGRGMFDPVSMDKIKRSIPDEWWQHKYEDGKADKGMKGVKLLRLERRAVNGNPTENLEGIEGQKQKGRLQEIVWWPSDLPKPAHLAAYHEDGEWEVRDTRGNNLVLWRDFSPEERQLMGELDEVKYAVARTLSMMSHDIEVGKYLDYIAKNHSEMMEPETGKIITEPWKFGALGDKNAWVKVPATEIAKTGGVKKYGNLAGRYIPVAMWNDIASMNHLTNSHSAWVRGYSKVMSMWKVNKTALSPAVHLNNVMANMIFADLHDVTADHMMKAADIMFGSDNPEKQAWINRFQDSGAMYGNFVSEELRKQNMQPLLDAMREEYGQAADSSTQLMKMSSFASNLMHARFVDAFNNLSPKAGKVAQKVANMNELMKKLYGHEDDFFRLATFIKGIEDGQSDKEAGKLARDAFLNYHVNAPLVNLMRQTAWPFFAFPYRAAPMLAKAVMERPHKLMKYAMMFQLMNWAVYAFLGAGYDNDRERALMRDEKSGKVWGIFPKLIRMPWGDTKNPEFLDVRRFLPLGDIYELSPNTPMPIPAPLFPSGPLFTLLAELPLNMDAFTGQPITNMKDGATLKHATDLMNYAWRSWMPNSPWMPNSYSQLSLWEATHGKTGPFGSRQSVFDSIASSVGVKLASYPQQEQLLYAKKELQSLRRGISEDRSQSVRDIHSHPGDPEVKAEAIKEIKEGKARYRDAALAFEAKKRKAGL